MKTASMGFQIDQAPGARNRRVLGRRLGEAQTEETTEGERISRPPGDAALRSRCLRSSRSTATGSTCPGVRLGRPSVAA